VQARAVFLHDDCRHCEWCGKERVMVETIERQGPEACAFARLRLPMYLNGLFSSLRRLSVPSMTCKREAHGP